MEEDKVCPQDYTLRHTQMIAQNWAEIMGTWVDEAQAHWMLEEIRSTSQYRAAIGSRFYGRSRLLMRTIREEGEHFLPDYDLNMDNDHPRFEEATKTGNRWRAECIKELARDFPQLEGLAASLNKH